ncbi:DUF2461 domain-containing protein [Leptobacterium sp. I13]|uniref:DUF2461 domain-containing protein n=1 Tax=Leptobacterium meishanense TaxID=3128904 RepID=UPI0030EE7222
MEAIVPKETFTFFKELKKNNNREWFEIHKKEFKAIEAQIKIFYIELMEQLQTHDEIEAYKLFRIYRDVRFSKDKTPYKTHFGGWYRRSKPRLRGGYYLHIAPGDTFIACGFWEPSKEDLFRIRKEFEQDASEVREIIENPAFKKVWGTLEGEEVKTAPKGFDKEHPDIDLIKKKQHIFIKKFTDKEVLAADFSYKVNEDFKTIRPYFDYMSDVLTTDLNGVSLID